MELENDFERESKIFILHFVGKIASLLQNSVFLVFILNDYLHIDAWK